MKYYPLYATETRLEATDLAQELNRAVAVTDLALVGRPAAGSLQKPYRYLVLTTSETLARNRDLLRVVRAGALPPRFPKLRLAKEYLFDVLIDTIGGLTRLIRRMKGVMG